MLRFFRINDPYRLIFIFLVLVIVRLAQGYIITGTSYYELKWLLLGEWLGKGHLMYSETFDYTGPIAAAIYKYFNLAFGRDRLSLVVFSTLLVILQASILNALLLKNKVYNENSYLPAFLYVIIVVSIPDFMTLSPQLMSLTFILLTLRNVLRRIDNQVTDELFLSSGIFIGIATMIYLPAVVFFLIFLFSLILFSTAIIRRLALYFFGFILIFSSCWVYFYLNNSALLFIERFFVDGLFTSIKKSASMVDLMIISAPLAFVFLVTVYKTLSAARLTNFQQKVQQVFWLLLVGGGTTFLLSKEQAGFELLFLAPVIAYFSTHYFILIKKKLIVAVMPGLLIIGLLVYSGYAYLYRVSPLTVDDTDMSKEKTFVLGEKLELYNRAEMITPCFNEYISERALARINYYTDASIIYDILVESDPQIIIDEIEAMPELMFRFPYLEENYLQVNSERYTKISN